MQNLTIKTLFQFSRTPMIKFLGPRDQLPKQNAKTPSSGSSSGNNFSTSKTEGKGISIPSVQAPFLTDLEIESVNMGGLVNETYAKVKPISLKK